jgi:hypothetical protein
MPLSLCQAARETGRSKSVLSHALKTGRMSGRRDDKGNWAIDPAELFRVFDPKPAKEPQGEQSSPAHAALIELLREQVRDGKQREQELREERNRLLTMLESEQQSRRELEVRLLPAPAKAKKKDKR